MGQRCWTLAAMVVAFNLAVGVLPTASQGDADIEVTMRGRVVEQDPNGCLEGLGGPDGEGVCTFSVESSDCSGTKLGDCECGFVYRAKIEEMMSDKYPEFPDGRAGPVCHRATVTATCSSEGGRSGTEQRGTKLDARAFGLLCMPEEGRFLMKASGFANVYLRRNTRSTETVPPAEPARFQADMNILQGMDSQVDIRATATSLITNKSVQEH